MKNYVLVSVLFGMGMMVFFGCETTYDAHRTSSAEMRNEGSVVFVRPDEYTILGTRSIRDYVEISYERLSHNEAGYPVVSVGLRNRGGRHIWDLKGGDVQLSVQTSFYKDAIGPEGAASGPAAYRSNWQTVKLVRGQTTDYQVVCPVFGADNYQVTISEYLR